MYSSFFPTMKWLCHKHLHIIHIWSQSFLSYATYFHIPLNQSPLKPSHIYLFTHPTPSFFNPTSENPFAKLLPHLSPSFPGPSFSDFPPGPPVPARPPSIHPANFRLRIFHKMFRNVPSLNVSTKVSNVPHTSFFVSLLMLSTGFTSMHSPRPDITVTHKD